MIIKEYTSNDGTQMYSATYGNTTMHSDDKAKIQEWLEDQILNAEYYAELERQSNEFKERVLNGWKFYE